MTQTRIIGHIVTTNVQNIGNLGQALLAAGLNAASTHNVKQMSWAK